MFSLKTRPRMFIVILILILGYNVYRNPAVLVGQTLTASSPGGSNAMHYKKQYQFSEDWFTYNIPVWQWMFERLKGKENLRYLEIGVFEGRSAIWMLENVLTHPTARLTAVDIFFGHLEKKFRENLEKSGFQSKVNILKGTSQERLRQLPVDFFDIIYIDGSHRAKHVFLDAALSWDLLKYGGLLIFDDYELELKAPADLRPKVPIDTFMLAFGEELELVHKGYQVAVRKTKGGCPKDMCSTIGRYGYAWLERRLYELPTVKAVDLSENEKNALEQLLRSYHDVRLDGRELAKLIEKDSVLRGLAKRISLTAKSVSE
jgi:Methyltransferase domain